MPKKTDSTVGESSGPALNGGRQTEAQRKLTDQADEGTSDRKRRDEWSRSGEPGRSPVALGGSSQGQSDRMPAGGASSSDARADNPAVTPGHTHQTD